MNIVFLVHPSFLVSQSMPRFAKMLSEGMKERGHVVEVWSPITRLSQLKMPAAYKKWLGYFGLYVIFPQEVQKRLKNCSPDTLFVVTDNALGPWVPLIANRPHIIHCHDFLAQRSALGEISENPLTWTGKQYQAFIRRGYSKGANFVSVSEKTRQDLHVLLSALPAYSEVVYTGLNQTFRAHTADEARDLFAKKIGMNLDNGYILHVGGNQWYKNRQGVIAIYDALRSSSRYALPLIMIGAQPVPALLERQAASPFSTDIHFFTGIPDAAVQLAYAGASLFLFPSLAEGFGWPIAEAMTAGCPVVTTGEAPMTEVAGKAGFFIPRRPNKAEEIEQWAQKAAHVVGTILGFSRKKRQEVIEAGFINAQRFDTTVYLNKVETIYRRILTTNQRS
ncbi:glycosyltransferase [Spirosoma areae]